MALDSIRIRGARENNLKNLDLEIPRSRLVVISGVSGSGKSSLLFDTIYAEGQRRYVESLSTYTRQFLERLPRPDLDSLEGIGPAVAIRQKNTVTHAGSTVATYTEVADYLRVLFARAGRRACPQCDREIKRDDPSTLALQLVTDLPGKQVLVTFPFASGLKLKAAQITEILLARGFARIVEKGEILRLDSDPDFETGSVLVLVDRLRLEEEGQGRLAEAIETAYHEGEGKLRLLGADGAELERYAEGAACAFCDVELPEAGPQFFSFHHTDGACPACRGYGDRLEFDAAKIIPDRSLSLADGAVAPWASARTEGLQRKMLAVCADRKIPVKAPFADLSGDQQSYILDGGKGFVGVLPWLTKLRAKSYKKYARFFSRRFMTEVVCEQCRGARLRPEVEQITIGDWSLPAFYRLPLGRAEAALDEMGLGDGQPQGVERVLVELRNRLRFLVRMGLGYLGLDRLTRTLSGGEFQRIHLANALGSHLTDTVYALDEPTVGLHPRDTDRLLDSLEELRDLGNSVILVEHDLDVIRRADELLDLGPGSGDKGGELVYKGRPEVERAVDMDHPSATLRFLADAEPMLLVDGGERDSRGKLQLRGVNRHNLKDLSVDIPLGQFVVVSGVSGSGKSTLITDVLVNAIRGDGVVTSASSWKSLRGQGRISDVLVVDQSPVGKSPRSNPATYMGAFSFIREIFAALPESRDKRMTASHFSFNSAEGRCPECRGLGSVKLEMVFMADIYTPCEACGGTRFREAGLQPRYKGKTIADVLAMTIDEAIHFFSGHHALGERLWMLHRVGLGYLKLGQGGSTLSGGESQRLKIARELASPGSERHLYVLDEPTTGLHPADVRQLLAVFRRLLKAGHSLVVIEHNLQVLLSADHIIDLGPEGGDAGGRIVAEGTPGEIASCKSSITGRYLAPLLKREKQRSRK